MEDAKFSGVGAAPISTQWSGAVECLYISPLPAAPLFERENKFARSLPKLKAICISACPCSREAWSGLQRLEEVPRHGNGFKRRAEAGLTRRTLGEGGDDNKNADEELQQILEQCIDMEEETGLLQQNFMSSVSDRLDVATIKAKMMEQMQAVASTIQPPFHSATPVSNQGISTWTVAQEMVPHTSSQSWGWVSGNDTLGNPVRQRTGAALTIVSPGEVSARALIPSMGRESSTRQILRIGGRGGTIEGKSLFLTSLGPDAWLDQIPVLAPGGKVAGEAAESVDELPASTAELPASAGAETGPEKAPTSNIHHNLCLHPFVRLPFVPQNAVRRELRLVGVATIPHLKGSLVKMLLVVRNLFAKSVLGIKDVELLMGTAEMLMRYATVKLQPRRWPDNAAEIARQAGILFMVLDTLICACQVLGPKAKATRWWNIFAEGFCTESLLREPLDFTSNSTYNHKLARRLLAAIDIYKTGARPDFREVIALKRMLLCSPFSPAYFKGSRWAAWRLDDETFRASQFSVFDTRDDEMKA
ncbi:hypothetical protein Emag_007643 [Eimeria magna]